MAGAGGAGRGETPNRWGPWLGSKQVAAVVLVLLAAEIGYVVHLNTEGSSSKSASPPPQSTLASPSTVAPSTPVTTVPPLSKPATTTTTPTATKPVTAAATASSTSQPCTAGDVDIVTTTGQSAYSAGQDVTMITTVTDVSSCIFQPEPVGEYDCPTSLVVVQAGSSSQAWPGTGGEDCNPPPGQTMNPGSTESLSSLWPAATAGTYQAVGTWGWYAGAGQPAHQISVGSTDFTVS